MKNSPYTPVLHAPGILDAVERWADGCLLLRETGAVRVDGRMDGLLIPVSWQSMIMKACRHAGFAGIEVKISRADFLRGLRSGQFDRYHEKVAGLYIATTIDVCQKKDLPDYAGWLVVVNSRQGRVCICKRHPKWHQVQVDADTLWRVLFAMHEADRHYVSQLIQEHHRIRNLWGERIGGKVMHLMAKLERSLTTER